MKGALNFLTGKVPITVVGSGSAEKIDTEIGLYFFANSAVCRATGGYARCVAFVSDGLLREPERFLQDRPVPGYSKEYSAALRRSKAETLKNKNFSALFVISGKSDLSLKRVLAARGITYQKLVVISRMTLYPELLLIMCRTLFHGDFIFKIRAIVNLLISLITGSKISSAYAPSTGAVAALWARKIGKIPPILDGVGPGFTEAFYPHGEHLVMVNFNGVHKKIDNEILSYATRSN